MKFNNDLRIDSDILERSEINSWSNMYYNAAKKCELFKIRSNTCFSIPHYESLTYNRVIMDGPDIISSKDFSIFDDFYRRKKINRYMVCVNPKKKVKLNDQFFNSFV